MLPEARLVKSWARMFPSAELLWECWEAVSDLGELRFRTASLSASELNGQWIRMWFLKVIACDKMTRLSRGVCQTAPYEMLSVIMISSYMINTQRWAKMSSRIWTSVRDPMATSLSCFLCSLEIASSIHRVHMTLILPAVPVPKRCEWSSLLGWSTKRVRGHLRGRPCSGWGQVQSAGIWASPEDLGGCSLVLYTLPLQSIYINLES